MKPVIGIGDDGCRSLSPAAFNAVQDATRIAVAPLAGGLGQGQSPRPVGGLKPVTVIGIGDDGCLSAELNAVQEATRIMAGGQGQSPSSAGGTKS